MSYKTTTPNNLLQIEVDELRKGNAITQKILDAILGGKGGVGGGSGSGLAAGGVGVAAAATLNAGVREIKMQEGVHLYNDRWASGFIGTGMEQRSILRKTRRVDRRGNILEKTREIEETIRTNNQNEGIETRDGARKAKSKTEHSGEGKEKGDGKKQTKDGSDQKKQDKEMFDFLMDAGKKAAPALAAAYATVKFMAPGQSRMGDAQGIHFNALTDAHQRQADPLFWMTNGPRIAWNMISGIAKGVR